MQKILEFCLFYYRQLWNSTQYVWGNVLLRFLMIQQNTNWNQLEEKKEDEKNEKNKKK